MSKLTKEERFLAKTKRAADGCLLWTGSKNSGGYGLVRWDGKTRKASRVAYEIASGAPIPEGMLVCHKCDNPPCVDPDHLFLGTHTDNIRDAAKKGRLRNTIDSSQAHFHSGGPPRGEVAGGAKLSQEQAERILALAADGALSGALARQFGVSRFTVQALLRGTTWKHLARPNGLPRRVGAYDRSAGRLALSKEGDAS